MYNAEYRKMWNAISTHLILILYIDNIGEMITQINNIVNQL